MMLLLKRKILSEENMKKRKDNRVISILLRGNPSSLKAKSSEVDCGECVGRAEVTKMFNRRCLGAFNAEWLKRLLFRLKSSVNQIEVERRLTVEIVKSDNTLNIPLPPISAG